MAAALTAALTTYLSSALDKGFSAVTGPPLTSTVALNRNPCEGAPYDYVVPSLPASPVDGGGMPQSFEESAPDGGYSDVMITFQGKSGTAVVLHALRVEVTGRAKAAGVSIGKVAQCGGLEPRNLTVDLDSPAPRAVFRPGSDEAGDGKPPVRFPFRVSDSDPEVFHVFGATRTCDCRWRILIDWSSQGKKGTLVIDDHGRPFRTVGIKDLPNYDVRYDDGGRPVWRRGEPPPDPAPLREPAS
ncbi:hypothetical protein [Nonomuraea sp. NPDC050643]|uniref:hypothetical protein n=1 Tax=Nonomuraea sp. NPDC050643 TaxID=3155660 RepID=UPI0033EACAFD